MIGQRITCLAAIALVMLVYGFRADNTETCKQEILRCSKNVLNNQSIEDIMRQPIASMGAFCLDDVIRPEAEAVVCVMNTLKASESCASSPIFEGPHTMSVQVGNFDVNRVDDGLTYVCNNIEAFGRVTACVAKGSTPAGAQCNNQLVQGLSKKLDEYCHLISVFLSCVNTESFPSCQEADLGVVKKAYVRLLPDGCVNGANLMHISGFMILVMIFSWLLFEKF